MSLPEMAGMVVVASLVMEAMVEMAVIMLPAMAEMEAMAVTVTPVKAEMAAMEATDPMAEAWEGREVLVLEEMEVMDETVIKVTFLSVHIISIKCLNLLALKTESME